MSLMNNIQNSMFSSLQTDQSQIAQMSNKKNLSDQDMIKFQMDASRYSTELSMTSNLLKTLSDNQKSIAQNFR